MRDPEITIEPANPEIVYVPEYDPWLVYGAPVAAWPGWYAAPGRFVAAPGIAFGVGFDYRILLRLRMGMASLGL